MIKRNGQSEKVYVNRNEDIETFLQYYNKNRFNTDEHEAVRVVSAALQKQRGCCFGCSGTVWPEVTMFDVHWNDGAVSKLDIPADKFEEWVAHNNCGRHKIASISDQTRRFEVWPIPTFDVEFTDGSSAKINVPPYKVKEWVTLNNNRGPLQIEAIFDEEGFQWWLDDERSHTLFD